jgi:uncharacterized protein (DUF433 family)
MQQKQKEFKRITIDPKILVGKPVIKGTRIPVYVVLNLLGEGLTFEEIIKDYPDLTKDDILESVRFAAQFTEFEEVEA